MANIIERKSIYMRELMDDFNLTMKRAMMNFIVNALAHNAADVA